MKLNSYEDGRSLTGFTHEVMFFDKDCAAARRLYLAELRLQSQC